MRKTIFLFAISVCGPTYGASGTHADCISLVKTSYEAANSVGAQVDLFEQLSPAVREGLLTKEKLDAAVAAHGEMTQHIGQFIDALSDACEELR